ncbi:hypothetical protein ACIWO4_11175 [Avibacterium paragallinarum]|uniref:hypothetical protein n=1 Tax=Avibacterium paragallinarum TaxID=728 RepID=UPI003986AD8B
MNINFTQIYQDCRNFMRNQPRTTQQFIVLFFINSMLFYFLISAFTPIMKVENMPRKELLLLNDSSNEFFVLAIAQQLISLFISFWGIATFHHISTQQTANLNQSATLTLRRFAGIIAINLIALIPIMIGFIEILFSILQKQSPSIFSLIASVLGFVIFVRLSLASTEYLIHPVTIVQALKSCWFRGVKRSSPLFIYCLFIYVALPFIVRQISSLSDNLIFELITLLISAIISVFSLLFTYRFYTLFMQKDE